MKKQFLIFTVMHKVKNKNILLRALGFSFLWGLYTLVFTALVARFAYDDLAGSALWFMGLMGYPVALILFLITDYSLIHEYKYRFDALMFCALGLWIWHYFGDDYKSISGYRDVAILQISRYGFPVLISAYYLALRFMPINRILLNLLLFPLVVLSFLPSLFGLIKKIILI